MIYLRSNRSASGSTTSTNVIIEIDISAHPEFWPAAQTFAGAFVSEGISAVAFSDIKTGASSHDVIHLLVGSKM
jgi:hypothetical protein